MSEDGNYKFCKTSVLYYEITIEQAKFIPAELVGSEECIAVGLADEQFPLQGYLPGWQLGSYAYHSDDGHCYRDYSQHHTYGKPFGPGDTVGCGIDLICGLVFFTLNGQFIDVAFQIQFGHKSALYPTVGVDTAHSIHFNFGTKPFKFDLSVLPTSPRTKLDLMSAYKNLSIHSKVGAPNRYKYGTKKFSVDNDPRLLRIARFTGLNFMNDIDDDDEEEDNAQEMAYDEEEMDNREDGDFVLGQNRSNDDSDDPDPKQSDDENEKYQDNEVQPEGFVEGEWDSSDSEYQDKSDNDELPLRKNRKRKRTDS